MKTMFDEIAWGNLRLKNRLIRSATMEIGGARKGMITPLLGQVYESLASGGVGLIITGMMGVAPNSCLYAGMAKIYDASFYDNFRAVANLVHQGGAKIVVQLGHCGAKAGLLDGDSHAYAPSDIADSPAQAMTIQQLQKLVKDYGIAARCCRESGADGVQIHGAHGYLINQFLSPLYNRRDDAYGGAIEGRARLLFEIYEEVREQVGKDYPVLLKISYSDLLPGGSSEAEVLWYCRELDQRGMNAIEVSAGIAINTIDDATGPTRGGLRDEAFNADYAQRLAQEIDCAVISVGGYRSPQVINQALNSGNIEAIALCRALIREPGLPQRWRAGDNSSSTCISCNKCFYVKNHGCYLDQAATPS